MVFFPRDSLFRWHLCQYSSLTNNQSYNFSNLEQLRTISAQVDDRLKVFDSDSESEDEDALKKAAEELKVRNWLIDCLKIKEVLVHF